MIPMWLITVAGGLVGGGIFIAILIAIAKALRVVVATNEVHIIQKGSGTVDYGKDSGNGNVYYNWPEWIPVLGVTRIELPVSIFDVDLKAYDAYDVGRVPFMVDVKAFYRITDATIAAQRVSSFVEILEQLKAILQGAVRKILASADIEDIMEGRGRFGEEFTEEVDSQLKEWGVQTVKSIEFMDIRDSDGSKVIDNIMKKKKSLIEKESRVAVAENNKTAEIAEIEALRKTEVQRQDAEEQIGKRTAQKDQQIGIANELAQQEIKTQAKVTAEKEMAVRKVEDVKTAEIAKDVTIVQATQNKEKMVINADAELAKKTRDAEGDLIKTTKLAEGITLEGTANAEAKRLMELAPISANIELAKEIGENVGYQKYLVDIRNLEKDQEVGIAQASALETGDLKIMVNSGDVSTGVNNIMDVFSPKGGMAMGGMLETLKQTPAGAALIARLIGGEKVGMEDLKEVLPTK